MTIATPTHQDEPLLLAARIGIDAEAFARSDFGKYLMQKAYSEIAAATDELISADAEDAKANRELRNQIHVAKMFLTWLDEAVHVGRKSYEELQELEDLAG